MTQYKLVFDMIQYKLVFGVGELYSNTANAPPVLREQVCDLVSWWGMLQDGQH